MPKKKSRQGPISNQERARRTLQKIIQACRDLLAHRSWEETSIRAIAKQAGSSSGAVYARFATKDDLLACIEQVVDGERGVLFAELLARNEKSSLRELVLDLARTAVAFHRRNGALIRAAELRPRHLRGKKSHRGYDPIFPYPLQKDVGIEKPPARATFDDVLQRIGAHHVAMSHPDAPLAAAQGFAALWAAVRDRVVFPGSFQVQNLDDDALCAELARAFVAYVGVSEASS